MKIVRLDIHHVHLPLREPWTTAYGSDDAVETVLLRATDADGATAWVETCPLGTPTYSPETAGGVAYMIRSWFGPLIVGRDLAEPREVARHFAAFRGNSFAKAGVECAAWALAAVRQGVPLRRLFGGGDRPVIFGDAIGRQPTIDALLAKVARAVARQAPRIKLKMAPGWDLEMLTAVRAAFPRQVFAVDCNGGYTLADLPLFRRVDELGLLMIEQPLYYRDLADHATLQRALTTPVCLDESITCRRDAEAAARLPAGRIVNIKIPRVGGVAEALAIHDLCREAGIGCWVGGMLESDLGSAFNLEFATLPNCRYPNDVPPSGMFYDFTLTQPGLIAEPPWQLPPAAGPYLGRTVDEDFIRAHTVGQWTLP